MQELWIPLTIAAAFLQNLRSAQQKHLKGVLSSGGAAYARFLYAAPFALVYLPLLCLIEGTAPPAPGAAFIGYVGVGAIAQIAATVLLLQSFDTRSFAVGTAYSKTESIQTVVVGMVVLGEWISGMAAAGIAVSLVGVLALSAPPRTIAGRRTSWFGAGARLGIAAGAGMALSAVCYRGAALSLADGSAAMRAACTLVSALVLQSVVMAFWLWRREPGELRRVLQARGRAVWVGVAGMLASAGWFTAMTLQTAAYVRALGQIELLFSFAASLLFFRETVRGLEVLGSGLLIAGIVLLLLG